MLNLILQALYDPRVRMPENEEGFRSALEEVELFLLSSQVCQLLKNSGRELQVPDFFRKALSRKYTQGALQNMVVRDKEDELLKCFEEARLDVIPLKGGRFAERYYGHLAGRLTSDIDLFVRKQDLEAAVRCTESAGYEFEIVKDHHARLHKGGFTVELHWTLDKPHWSEVNTEPFWLQAVPAGEFRHVKELSLLDTFYFVCLHGVRHQMDSLRYVLDVAQVLFTRGRELNYGELMRRAEADKTGKRVRVALSVAYRLFPRLHELKPLPFEPVESHWDYRVIRDARMGTRTVSFYLYKLYFKYFLYDTLKYQLRSIRKAY
jgi:hypothetical protein